MSDIKTISPLLDEYTVGNANYEHFGVCCRPAIKGSFDKKYIVKQVSVPQSRTQFEALTLAGVSKDTAAAAEYFRLISEEIVSEASFLKVMAKTPFFLAYEDWQTVPMENGLPGYEIYLLAPYRRSLEKYLRRNGFNHLEAVNLAIDMCEALSACRKEGMLYVALKPSNIYTQPKRGYKIGDLGFVSLSVLQYTSMPARYRSAYTAPELMDDLTVLNPTADTYSLGMILYRIFNDGKLPESKYLLEPPVNGDEQINRILLKACNPNPEERWQTPLEMEQALITYLQSSTINATPLLTPAAPAEKTSFLPIIPKEAENAAGEAPVDAIPQLLPEEPETPAIIPEETETPAAEVPETAADAPVSELTEESENPPSSDEEAPSAEEPASADASAPAEEAKTEEAPAAEPEQECEEQPTPEELSPEDLFEQELAEVNQLLSTKQEKKLPLKHAPIPKTSKSKWRTFFGKLRNLAAAAALLAAIGFGVYFGYVVFYVQTVSELTVEGSLNTLTVSVKSDIADGLLVAACSDSYGNTLRKPVENGHAVFEDLTPGFLYKIQLEIQGFHKLEGPTSQLFTTEAMSNVISLTAVTGMEDGSVILNLTTEGFEPPEWKVYYSAEGEPELAQTFSGHSVSIANLVIGKEYSFRLEGKEDLPLIGQLTVQHTASALIVAENLGIESIVDGNMTIQWTVPGELDTHWTARCYGNGYDTTIEVDDTKAVFSDIQIGSSYTIEVYARGMSVPAKANLAANPVTVTDISVDESDPKQLLIQWEYTGTPQENGWLVSYTIDQDATSSFIKCETASAAISPRIPGATYHITIQNGDGTSVLDGSTVHQTAEASRFSGHGLTSYKITAELLPTPEREDWSFYNTPSALFTKEFSPNEKISMVLHAHINFYLDKEDVVLLYVIRDEYGNVIQKLTACQDNNWEAMWFRDDYHYCELNATQAPDQPGTYTLELYLNGKSLTANTFTVS